MLIGMTSDEVKIDVADSSGVVHKQRRMSAREAALTMKADQAKAAAEAAIAALSSDSAVTKTKRPSIVNAATLLAFEEGVSLIPT